MGKDKTRIDNRSSKMCTRHLLETPAFSKCGMEAVEEAQHWSQRRKSTDGIHANRLLRLLLILVTLAIAFLMEATLAHAQARSEHSLSRRERQRLLEAVMMGIHNYHDSMKCLPAAIRRDHMGRPLSSWRFALLPYVESGWPKRDPYAFWSDPVNHAVAARRAYFYCFGERSGPRRFETNVVAVTGPGTCFDERRRYTFRDLKRDTADTALILEVRATGFHWMEPGDLDLNAIDASTTAGLDGTGVHVGFADGKVWFLRREVPWRVLKEFFTVEGSRHLSREEVLGKYRVP